MQYRIYSVAFTLGGAALLANKTLLRMSSVMDQFRSCNSRHILVPTDASPNVHMDIAELVYILHGAVTVSGIAAGCP